MLEQLKYKNHLNEVFEFGKDGIYINTSDLHNYKWTVTQKGNRISGFDYGVQERTLPVIIMCGTEEQGIEARNRLFEITEKDIRANQHGQIIIGDYYFKCFVTGSTKANYLTSGRYITISLALSSDFPYWVKETVHGFGVRMETFSLREPGIDYPFDYPYDYPASVRSNDLNNTDFVASNFRMIIYGACTNPAVTIGEHTYRVNCTVNPGEYLVIDSVAKTVKLTQNNGFVINKFNDRDKDSYIFEKIPPGKSFLSWSGDFGFDIILLEERSEPKWT